MQVTTTTTRPALSTIQVDIRWPGGRDDFGDLHAPEDETILFTTVAKTDLVIERQIASLLYNQYRGYQMLEWRREKPTPEWLKTTEEIEF